MTREILSKFALKITVLIKTKKRELCRPFTPKNSSNLPQEGRFDSSSPLPFYRSALLSKTVYFSLIIFSEVQISVACLEKSKEWFEKTLKKINVESLKRRKYCFQSKSCFKLPLLQLLHSLLHNLLHIRRKHHRTIASKILARKRT